MKLVIGGRAQGKLAYARKRYRLSEEAVWDGCLPDGSKTGGQTVVVNHVHLWVKKRILEQGNPEEEILAFLESCPDCVIIGDEIGNGIIPTDAGEREYRERTGRIFIRLAEQAEEVTRVICGIGQKIK